MTARTYLALVLVLSAGLAGCAGSDVQPFEPSSPIPGPEHATQPGSDPGTEPGTEPVHAVDAIDRSGYPYHESPENGIPDYANSTWDPQTLTGYNHTYRPLNNRSDGSPYGVHLSHDRDPKTTITITWFTAGTGIDVEPAVEWGLDPANLTETITAETTVAYPGDPAEDPANPVDVSVHTARITGLTPGQWIAYRVNGATGASPIYDAHTDPGADAEVKILHWGDQGVIYDGAKNTTGWVLEHIARGERPDLLVIAGDLAYADGTQWKWDDYFWYFEPLFARVPMMAASGNHEAKDGELSDGFRSRLAFPGTELQYSFTYGAMAITIVDTEGGELLKPTGHLEDGDVPGAVGATPRSVESYVDIATLLREAAQMKADGEIAWSSVLQHVPIYSNHATRGDNYQLTVLEEPHLVANDVDLLMAGHNHHYERSKPMAFGQPYDDGYVQIINGGGGKSYYEFLPEDQFADWSAAFAKRQNIVEYTVTRDTVTGNVYATDSPLGAAGVELLDTFTL